MHAMLPQFRFSKEGITEENSYEHHVYESVDDRSLSIPCLLFISRII